jgi:hypothetical protein
MGKTRNEQMFSGLPSLGDIAQRLGAVAQSADELRPYAPCYQSQSAVPLASRTS